MDNPRSRNWCLILYPEDPTHCECLDILHKGGWKYAAIRHDRDVWEDGESENHVAGELKKPHWHVVLCLKNPQYRNGIAKELGIKPNYIEVCRGRDNALLYLVHDGFPEKFQYDVTDVFGPLSPNLEKLLVCEDEGERVMTILKILDSFPGVVTYRKLLEKVIENKLYGDFRRMGSGVRSLIEEHNAVYMDMSWHG